MKLSEYFLPILKETPQDAQIISHQLMLRAGMVKQESAGIYAWLPLGFRVLKKIEQIIREEQDRAGAIELLMPTLQSADLWRESGRYDDYGLEMLRIKDRHDRDMLYGPTNEEMISDIFRAYLKSYRDVPKLLYHIQWKFRDEIRPRFGVMRGREFLMKDTYSFDISEEAARISYQKMFEAYHRTFHRLGLKALAVRADSGAIGGDLSHEFHILAKTGESQIYYDPKIEAVGEDWQKLQTLYAAADELHKPESCPIPESQLKTARGIEVGHIFYFGTKYSESMNVKLATKDGKSVYAEMGSYGIGVSRLVGAIIEASHDDKGIIWPQSVSPFDIGLINLKVGDTLCDTLANTLYTQLQQAGFSVLYEDRDISAGAKFATQDLIGLPWQVIIGPKLAQENQVELKNRKTDAREVLSLDALFTKLKD